MAATEGLVRIGELSRRLGVGHDRLRAWERRYGLLQPVRTPGGFRLYSRDDEQRVRDMQDQLAHGLSAAQAAEVVLATHRPPAGSAPLDDLRTRLVAALAAFDDAGANTLLDRLLAVHGPDVAMRDVIYPSIRMLGEAWERAEIDVGEEHFASSLIHGRLLTLAHGWQQGRGPRAVLACAPGEQHSLGLIGLGVCLSNRGWRVTYLGADTPVATTARTAAKLLPELVVISSTVAPGLAPHAHELRTLAASIRLALAGAAVGPALAERVGAEHLDADPVTAGQRLSGLPRRPRRSRG